MAVDNPNNDAVYAGSPLRERAGLMGMVGAALSAIGAGFGAIVGSKWGGGAKKGAAWGAGIGGAAGLVGGAVFGEADAGQEQHARLVEANKAMGGALMEADGKLKEVGGYAAKFQQENQALRAEVAKSQKDKIKDIIENKTAPKDPATKESGGRDFGGGGDF